MTLTREDALTRLRQARNLQPGEGTMQVATGIVDAILEGERSGANLSERLRAERQRRRISLRDLADETGVSFNTLSRVEHGADCWHRHALAILRWIGDEPAVCVYCGQAEGHSRRCSVSKFGVAEDRRPAA